MNEDEFVKKYIKDKVYYDAHEVEMLVRKAWIAGLDHVRKLLLTAKLRLDAQVDQEDAKWQDMSQEQKVTKIKGILEKADDL